MPSELRIPGSLHASAVCCIAWVGRYGLSGLIWVNLLRSWGVAVDLRFGRLPLRGDYFRAFAAVFGGMCSADLLHLPSTEVQGDFRAAKQTGDYEGRRGRNSPDIPTA